MKNENYYVVHGWMINELHLKSNDLAVYAIIYGFTQNGDWWNGSLKFLSDWTNTTKQSVLNNLKRLTELGLIERQEATVEGVKFVSYRSKKFNGGIKESLTGGSKKFNGGIKKSLPNKDSNIEIDKELDSSYRTTTRFQPPTVEDVRAYCAERGNGVDAQRFVDYYAANGWRVGKNHMRDWRAAVRTWERNERDKPAAAASQASYDVNEALNRARQLDPNDTKRKRY